MNEGDGIQMTKKTKSYSVLCNIGFIVSLAVPVVTVILFIVALLGVIVVLEAVGFNIREDPTGAVYLISRFVASVVPLIISVSGFIITKKKYNRVNGIAIAGTIISSLQLLICILLLLGGLFLGLDFPHESPPQSTLPYEYTQS